MVVVGIRGPRGWRCSHHIARLRFGAHCATVAVLCPVSTSRVGASTVTKLLGLEAGVGFHPAWLIDYLSDEASYFTSLNLSLLIYKVVMLKA